MTKTPCTLIIKAMLFLFCLASVSSSNAQNQFSLGSFQWDDCPQLQIDGVNSQLAASIILTIERVQLDTQCLSQTADSSKPSTASISEQLHIIIKQISEISNQLPIFDMTIKSLQIRHGEQQLQGSLSLEHQNGRFQAKFSSQQGLKASIVLDEQQLRIPNISLERRFLNQFGPELPAFFRKLSITGDLWPQLALNSHVSIGSNNPVISVSLRNWENKQLAIQSDADISIDGLLLPNFVFKLSESGLWSAASHKLELQAQGRWQWPQLGNLSSLATQGKMSAAYSQSWNNYLPKTVQPKALQILNGAIQANWSSKGLRILSLEAGLDNGHALWDDISVDDLDIKLKGQQNQAGDWTHHGSFDLSQVNLGIQVSDIKGRWWQALARPIDDLSALRIQDISFKLFEGLFLIPSLQMPLPSQANLDFKDLQLSHITELYPDLSLAADGKLSGRFPLNFSEQGLSIEKGKLKLNPALGYLRLSHPSVLELKTQHQSLDFSLSLLEDFSFEQLHADVSLSTEGEMSFNAQIQGHNRLVTPRRIDLNYTHQENIYQLMRSLRIGDELSGKLQEWIDRYSN